MTSTPTIPPIPPIAPRWLEGPNVYTGVLDEFGVRRTHRNVVFWTFHLNDGVEPVVVGYLLGEVLAPVHTATVCDVFGLVYPEHVHDLRRLLALFPYDHKETVEALRMLVGHVFTVHAVERVAKFSDKRYTTYHWSRAAN